MRIGVIGGRLQGLEATYLAKQAGWEVVLFDRRPAPQALYLADHFIQAELSSATDWTGLFKGLDLIIPALENEIVLNELALAALRYDLPVALDLDAYRLSASKSESDRLFQSLKLPAPAIWPDCSFPMIGKPVQGSGSEGVQILANQVDLDQFKTAIGDQAKQWVIQEYLSGPSYSIEVVGYPGCYLPLQVTELAMDELYDCKRVLAPADLSSEDQQDFASLAVRLAEAVKLTGIMDLEVILNDHRLKILEIDARLPSQTPIAVYHSSGINMLELLALCYGQGTLPSELAITPKKAASFEHIVVSAESITFCGEHAIASAGPLRWHRNFFGADEALTNYKEGKAEWLATLIITAADRKALAKKRSKIFADLKKTLQIDSLIDPEPAGIGKDDK